MLEWALDAASLGYEVFPCAPGGRTPLGLPTDRFDRNHADSIKAWWGCHPDANIGARLSRFNYWGPTAATVLCVDPLRGASLGHLELERDLLPNSRVVSAPGGVIQIHMRGSSSSRLDFLGPGFDVRSADDYVLMPGSRVGNEKYAWRRLEIVERNAPIHPVPSWFPTDGGRPIKPEPHSAMDNLEDVDWAVRYLARAETGNIAGGIKSRALLNVITALARHNISETTALGLIAFYFAGRCSPAMLPHRRPNDLLREAVHLLYERLNATPISIPPPHSTR